MNFYIATLKCYWRSSNNWKYRP